MNEVNIVKQLSAKPLMRLGTFQFKIYHLMFLVVGYVIYKNLK